MTLDQEKLQQKQKDGRQSRDMLTGWLPLQLEIIITNNLQLKGGRYLKNGRYKGVRGFIQFSNSGWLTASYFLLTSWHPEERMQINVDVSDIGSIARVCMDHHKYLWMHVSLCERSGPTLSVTCICSFSYPGNRMKSHHLSVVCFSHTWSQFILWLKYLIQMKWFWRSSRRISFICIALVHNNI